MAEPMAAKTQPPFLENWREQVEDKIKQGEYEKKDVLEIIWLAQKLLKEIETPSRWVSEQLQYLSAIAAEYKRIYATRFGEQAPPRPETETVPPILIDVPERRKEVVRDVALSVTKVGDTITYKEILEELKRRGIKLVADNPNATISTILRGFKPQFIKVEGKRGTFQRQE